MKRNYHISSSGKLKRKQNTVQFVPDDGSEKTYIPIEDVDAVYCHSPIRVNTKLYSLFDEHTVELHIFSYTDQYVGSFVPTDSSESGASIVKQVENYSNPERRRSIAQKIVDASSHNMKKNITYYNNKEQFDFRSNLDKIEYLESKIYNNTNSVDDLMGIEGSIRKEYYSVIQDIIPSDFNFESREYNPPTSEFNALLSYGNSLLYSSVSSAIGSTELNPTISFLHEPANRRHSLSLDIADIFKPVLVDRLLFRVVNRKQISPADFDSNWMLSDSARDTIILEYEDLMEETIKHPDLNKHVSYQYLLRLEALNLQKHILTGEEYKPFKRWW